jgi:hypothetical protein
VLSGKIEQVARITKFLSIQITNGGRVEDFNTEAQRTPRNIEKREWKNGMVEKWNDGRLEWWNGGILE